MVKRRWTENWTWFVQTVENCVTQLKLQDLDKLSSSIFCVCEWVSECVRDRNDRPNLHFFNIFRYKSPLLSLYQVPSSTNLYWPSTTKYQPVSSYTDSVPSSTNQYHFIIHHPTTHSWANWVFFLFTTHLMSHAQYTWSSSSSSFTGDRAGVCQVLCSWPGTWGFGGPDFSGRDTWE